MEEQEKDIFELHLDAAAQASLREASKWGKFLAILGFIFEGLFAILSFFAPTITELFYRSIGGLYQQSQDLWATVVYLGIVVLLFFPTLYLYQFSIRIRKAVDTSDQESMTFAFARLKSLFKFRGILAIVGISAWLLILVALMVGAMLATRG